MARRSTTLLVAVLMATSMSTAATSTATAAGQPPAVGPDGVVTLVTGDRVEVRDGRAQVRGRAGVVFWQYRDERGDLHVVPSDAAADVRSGRLDERLFDVTGLIRAGYDDRSSAVTPLIVTSSGTRSARALDLPGIGGYALEVPKDAGFWSGARTAGVDKVWLDGPVRASLDRSVPQVGAPEAWQAGYTGRGATVAVLDSGIDATHPDLAGAVVEAKDFSGSGSTDDRVGHGTHVAATITGSGRYRGVAPDSALLVGKVLGDTGGGRESGIIAGMQWAAEAHADVVNLSLGDSWPTDGSDPMSTALNRISAEHDVLFVVAAGNSGPDGQTIGSPAAADAALTVGAVDRDDRLAGFSSRGPRRQDDAIKPDITAPGVGIVAAKAKNGAIGEPVDATHVALSGTSMATPHVAGAAAILAAQHPDWTAQQLKGALMGSAKPNPALSVFEQGAGRVDVARASRQTVWSSPGSLSLGTALWPHDDDPVIERTVSYRNDGADPVPLTFAAGFTDPAGNPAPAGMVTVTPAEVVVAPGTSADVRVAVRTSSAGPDGIYSGALVATGGDTVVRTPLAVTKEVESYDVKLTVRDPAGEATPDYWARFVSIAQSRAYVPYDASGVVRTRLPKGEYYFDGWVQRAGEDRRTMVVEPRLVVDRPVELDFDAREGRRITIRVDQAGAAVGRAETFLTMRTDWGSTGSGSTSRDFGTQFYVPSKTSSPGRAQFTVQGTLAEPDGGGTFVGSPYQYHVSSTKDGGVPVALDFRHADRDLARVESRVAASGEGQFGFRDQVAGGPLPLRLVERYTPGVDWYGGFAQDDNPWTYPAASQSDAAPRRFAPRGQAGTGWNQAVFGPAVPFVPTRPYRWAAREGDAVSVGVPLFTDQDPNHYGFSWTGTARTTLHRDGTLIADVASTGLNTDVPAGKGAFRLHTEAARDVVSELSTRVGATWTFGSDTVAGDPAALPLLVVRFAPLLDERNRTAAGRPFAFPVYVQRNGSAQPGDVNTSVQVSYDDGASWRPVPLLRTGDRWMAAVLHPPGAKYVSLRASANDRDGNSVEQTIIRAYALK